MKTIIHEIDKKTRRISLVYPEKTNVLADAGKHFTMRQKIEAKVKYEASFRNRKRNRFYEERAELIKALAETKRTPNMNLIVTVNTRI